MRRFVRVARGVAYALWSWLLFAVLFAAILGVAAVFPGNRAWNFSGACATSATPSR